LLWSILTTFLTLPRLIRKRFEVILIWFVTGIHYCYFLPIYFKIRIVCFLECNCCLIRRVELNKGKILKCSCQLIFDLPNILYWSELLKQLKQSRLLDIANCISPKHQTAILSWFLP
jgi:hypothetical protein